MAREFSPSAASPCWTADGATIVFTGSVEPGDSMSRLWRVDARTGGEAQPLGDDFVDVMTFPLTRALAPQLSADGSRILYITAREGTSDIAAIDLATGRRETAVGGDHQIVLFHAAADTLAYVAVSIAAPGELTVADAAGGHQRPRIRHNAWWHERTPMQMERMSFGEDNRGWLFARAGLDGAAPLFVDVHGGPQSFAELQYAYHPYWWVLCSRASVRATSRRARQRRGCTDPRGSPGVVTSRALSPAFSENSWQ